MKIYTKTGDRGQTSLYGGKRVSKNDPQVEAYGTVDELNSAIGVAIVQVQSSRLRRGFCLCVSARRQVGGQAKFKVQSYFVEEILKEIQGDLFSIGAMLAGDKRNLELRTKSLEQKTKNLEEMIDWMAQELPEQRHFILPNGSKPSAFLHLARTICRRAERRVVALKREQSERVDETIINQCLIYLNRLSDFFYTLARWANYQLKEKEIVWYG